VFLRKVKTASGATAVQIAERRGRRDRVIEHLGSAHTEAELAVLMQVGRAKIHAGQGVLNLGLDADPGSAVVRSSSSRLLIDVLTAAWAALGLDDLDDQAFFQLVAARLIEPTSMLDSARVLDEVGIEPMHRNTFHAALRRCAARDYRDRVADKCFVHARAHVWCPDGEAWRSTTRSRPSWTGQPRWVRLSTKALPRPSLGSAKACVRPKRRPPRLRQRSGGPWTTPPACAGTTSRTGRGPS
jgi:hypothetical protein